MGRISFAQALRNIKRFSPIQETKRIIEENPEPIIEAIQKQLYEKGQDSTGKKLKGYKSKDYAKKKHGMNPLPGLGTPDFKLTGATYNEMEIITDNTGYTVQSATPYFPVLIKERGRNSFKMNAQNVIEYRRKNLFPAFRMVFMNRLKGR